MLCSYCQIFDYDQLVSLDGYRRGTWEDLYASAERGCSVCQLVKDNVHSKPPGPEGEVVCTLKASTFPGFASNSLVWSNPTSLIYATLIVCTQSDDPLSKFIKPRLIDQSISSKGCISLMNRWLEKCATSHPCPPQQDHVLPSRVIDVGSDINPPRLVITNGRAGRWTALSHCWGHILPVRTDSQNIDQYCKSIPLSTLTPNFRDAILITRSLGIRYLWIDALCIVQDSIKDWYSESRKMSYVYENAVCTIAAEASEGSSSGIFASIQVERQLLKSSSAQALCRSAANQVQGAFHFFSETELDPPGQVRRGPPSRRCWAMQEELLSTRIIRFSAPYLTWRCTQSRMLLEWDPEKDRLSQREFSESIQELLRWCSDSSIIPTENVRTVNEGESDEVIRYWYTEVVNYYIGRHITYDSDRLVAIYGVAKRQQDSIKGLEYLAGIWTGDIHRGLAWATQGAGARRHNIYVAPSWSWAQLDCRQLRDKHMGTDFIHHYLYRPELFHNRDGKSLYKSLIKLTDSSNNIVDGPSGPVEHWILSLEGYCWELCSCQVPIPFLDERFSSADDLKYVLEEISDPENEFMDRIGLKSLTRDVCLKPGCDEHQRWTYLVLGRLDPYPNAVDMRKKRALPLLVALILEEVIGKDNESMHKRVGRALIPIERQEGIEWPKKIFNLI